MRDTKPILETKHITKRFPGVTALSDVNFELIAGEIHGLVGHNGAGKSTLAKILTGTYRPDAGEILIEGQPVAFRHPKDAIDVGIGSVAQEGTLLPSFTVAQNMFLGRERCHAGIVQERYLIQAGENLLEATGLTGIVNVRDDVRKLGPAQRKIVEILKILTLHPRIVIFDESTAALSENERSPLFAIMDRFRKREMGVVFITHYIEEVIEVCDRTTVMRDGRIVGSLTRDEADKDTIVRMMIDRERKTTFPNYTRAPGAVLVEIEHLGDGGAVKDATLNVRRGEIVGLFGTIGSGRTELGELIFGARKRTTGRITKDSRSIAGKSVRQAIAAGMALVPDDRLTKALMLEESVVDNITLPFLEDYTSGMVVNRRRECDHAQGVVDGLDIRTPSLSTQVRYLSGGNKQKVSFAKWIGGHGSDFYIFDEPTEGVDVGACVEMYQIIAKLVERGGGCLVISSDIQEIIGLSDRIFIMREGTIVGEFLRDETDLPQKLLAASLGFRSFQEKYRT